MRDRMSFYDRVELLEDNPRELKTAEVDYIRALQDTTDKLVDTNFRAIQPHLERLATLRDKQGHPGSYHEIDATREDMRVRRLVVIAPTTLGEESKDKVIRVVVNEDGRDPTDLTRYRLDMHDYLIYMSTGVIAKRVSFNYAQPPRQQGWEIAPNSGPYIHVANNQAKLYEGSGYSLPVQLWLVSDKPLDVFSYVDGLRGVAAHLIDVLQCTDGENQRSQVLVPEQF